MRRVVLACGIVGGVWGVLAPILVLVPMSTRMVSLLEMGMARLALPILSFIALMGMLGLLAIVLSQRRSRIGKPLLWTSAIAILLASIVSIFELGLFSLPASVLLLVAAIGLKGELKRGVNSLIQTLPHSL